MAILMGIVKFPSLGSKVVLMKTSNYYTVYKQYRLVHNIRQSYQGVLSTPWSIKFSIWDEIISKNNEMS